MMKESQSTNQNKVGGALRVVTLNTELDVCDTSAFGVDIIPARTLSSNLQRRQWFSVCLIMMCLKGCHALMCSLCLLVFGPHVVQYPTLLFIIFDCADGGLRLKSHQHHESQNPNTSMNV